jgi:hypothetical protein
MTSSYDSSNRYAIAAQEDRSAPRISLKIPATLRPSGQTGFSVVVRDLSLSGFACEAVTGMHVGTICWLTLPGLGGLQAEVMRNDGIVVGCAFANLLNPAVLDSVIARAS